MELLSSIAIAVVIGRSKAIATTIAITSGPDSTEIRVAVSGSSPVPGLWVVGVDGLVIEWIVAVWRLEL